MRIGAFLACVALVVATAHADSAILDDPKLARSVDVSPLSGRLNVSLEDLRPGGDTPWPLSLRRTYLPGWGTPHNHGLAWVTLLDSRLAPWQDGFVLLDPAGGLRRFAAEGDGWVATSGRPTRLLRAGDGGWRLVRLEGGLEFDAAGRLLRVEGRQTSLVIERDASGRATAIKGPWGEVRVERDAAGLLQALACADGRRVDYSRNDAGQLAEVRRLGVRQRFTYDDQGRLSALGGELVQVRYDDAGRVAEVATQGLEPTRYAYAEEAGELIGTTTRGERVVRTVASSDLRRVREESAGEVIVTELDKRGRVVRQVVDGVEHALSYDAQGRVTASGASRFTYTDPTASVPSRVNTPEGAWTFTRDDAGNVTSARSSSGTTRWVYDSAGRMTQVVAEDGTVLELRYDEAHRRIGSRLVQGSRQLERRAQRPEGVFGVSTVEHEDGRTRTVERKPDGTLVLKERDDAGRALRTIRYDALGRAVERTNARGVTRRFTYDALGRWVNVLGAAGTRLEASYDALGQLAALTDGNGNQTRVSRDEGWVVVEEPSWGERRSQTLPGRRTDRAGEVSYAARLNERGQLIARTLPEGEERIRYDVEGRLLEAKGPDGGLRYAYDGRGRVTRVSLVGVDAAVSYTYTAAGQLERATYPWGSVEHRYNDAGQLEVMDLGALGEVRFSYDARGRRVRVAYPSGVETHTAWEGDRVREVRTVRGEDLLERRAYTYDAAGRLAEIQELDGRVTLEHDAEGQLVAARGPGFERAYRYDAMGNRVAVERDGASQELTVAAGNRLAAQADEAFTYGPRGALTQRGAGEQATRYRYDSLNRLVGATLPDGREVRYGYAPNGERLWREDAAGRVYFVPGAAGPVAEVDANGAPLVGYLQGQRGLDDLLGAVREGGLYGAHTDCVNSVTALTSPQGEVTARYRYTPFGETVEAEGGAWNRLRFTARPLDSATGLYQLRARSYAPDLGRFTSPDPAGYRGGANFYAYCSNDPSLLRDPLGLFPGGLIPGPFDEWAEDAIDGAVDLGGDALDAGGDVVGDVVDLGEDIVDVGGDVIGVGVDAADWLWISGPLGVDHNPFFFGGIPNPFALDETLSFWTGFGTSVLGTVTSPYHLARAFIDDPLGTTRTFAELSLLVTAPGFAPLYAAFGPEDNAISNLNNSILTGLGNYWDAFLNDPEEFWRRNGEIAPTILGAIVTGGSSATLTLLLKINEILSNIGYAVTILEAAQPEEEAGKYTALTIPGVSFESLDDLALALVVAAVTELEVTGRYTYSSELLDESYDDFDEFMRAALELPEVQEVIATSGASGSW